MRSVTKLSLVRLAGLAAMTAALMSCGGEGESPSAEPAADGAPAAPAAPTSSAAPAAPTVDPGTSVSTCAPDSSSSKPPVTAGTWRAGGPREKNFTLLKETAHFVFYSDEAVPDADLTLAAQTLEGAWHNMLDTNLLMPEP